MDRSDIAALLASAGMPVVYWKWPDGSTPAFPCIRYSEKRAGDFIADNRNYVRIRRWSAIIVSEWKDDAAEAALEAALDAAGIAYDKSADWYSDESRLNHVEYTFSVPR